MRLPDPSEWPVPAETDVATLLGDETADLLSRRAAATADRTALVDAETGARVDYGTLDRQVGRVAGRIDRLAESAGSADAGPRVGLLLGTRPAFGRIYFAVARLGGVVAPLNVQLPAETLADQAARAAVDLLVCAADTEADALAAAPPDVPVASVDEPSDAAAETVTGAAGDGAETARGDGTARVRAADPVRVSPDRDRLVAFTSGTTGRPKGVRLTLGNLVASAAGSAARLGVDPDDRWLTPLPAYHVGGLAPLVRSTLYGTATVLQREFDATATARVLDEYGVSGVSLVPTMLSRLLDAGWSPPDALRFVLVGGGPAPQDLVERALDRGVPVYPTYGTTETASQVATATPAEAEAYPGTVGHPLPRTGVTVLSGDGERVPAGERGEIVVDGPTVTPGYLDGRGDAFGPHGFHTGDLGYRDADGRLWVVGRIDGRIVTGGENVAPDRVAAALRDHELVADAAVVGLPDEEWGERVAALVVPASRAGAGDGNGTVADGSDAGDAELTAERVREHARDRLADFAVPKAVAFADSLPRTASGTVDREAVAERLRGGAG